MAQNNGMDGVWSVVLAGGEGTRMSQWLLQRLGHSMPKQFCTFTGTRSLLQHTLDRADRVSRPENKVVVVPGHYLADTLFQMGRRKGLVVPQPRNVNTAAGIMLPLTYVRALAPDSTVIVFPSDHFVYPEDGFVEEVRRVALLADSLPDHVMLLGVRPVGVESEYGWIVPGQSLHQHEGHTVYSVSAFLEKPNPAQAAVAFEAGGIWNTFIMVGKLRKIWDMTRKWCPSVVFLFEWLTEKIGSEGEAEAVDTVYDLVPSQNFSYDVLRYACSELAVYPLEGLVWSDWGKPERVEQSLSAIGGLARPWITERTRPLIGGAREI